MIQYIFNKQTHVRLTGTWSFLCSSSRCTLRDTLSFRTGVSICSRKHCWLMALPWSMAHCLLASSGSLAGSSSSWQGQSHRQRMIHLTGVEINTCSELYSGGCTPHSQSISECYELRLSGDPNTHLDPKHLQSPRQRVEFRSPGEMEGMPVPKYILMVSQLTNSQTARPGCTLGVPITRRV